MLSYNKNVQAASYFCKLCSIRGLVRPRLHFVPGQPARPVEQAVETSPGPVENCRDGNAAYQVVKLWVGIEGDEALPLMLPKVGLNPHCQLQQKQQAISH